MGDEALTGEIWCTVIRRGGRSKRENECHCRNPVKDTKNALELTAVSPSHSPSNGSCLAHISCCLGGHAFSSSLRLQLAGWLVTNDVI